MDIISQLQEQVNTIAALAFNTFGTLQRDAPPFDALVAALPLSDGGEEAQLKRIAELQAENDAVGQELQKQLEAAEKELKQVQELFNQATDNCLNLKKPE
ncbi:hypothetical protein MTR67_009644 [Solanum verrucosum]|uniref:Mediator of RNA polymerase II transcription subunit 21 n=1 Tax=Solanum verrucosum TaxID=315347 RepID=A0AAF0Q3K4_SOLVR|nr:hypothetical protein MTR67_009644 [Solanum verrucosum]